MANDDVKNSAEKLMERILADARAQAEETAQQAKTQCDDILQAGEKSVRNLRMQDTRRLNAEIAAAIDRNRTNAELEARKDALAARREVIEEVFSKTYEALCALDDDTRAKVIVNLLLGEADGAETLVCAAAERTLVEKLLPQVQQALRAQGKKELILSCETADIEHGFLLIGNGYEKNCSFKAVLDEMREEQEPEIAGILFQ